MARFDDVTAAVAVYEADLEQSLDQDTETSATPELTRTPRPVAHWYIDEHTGRPVCRWTIA